MNETILLCVDARHCTSEATDAARALCHGADDKIVVLHVHEFAVGRFGRLQVDCPEGAAEQRVPEVVSSLRAAGVTAEAEIRETGVGQVAKAILKAADEHDARIIVVGSSGHTDLPRVPLGSVSHKLLHHAERPVLVVPRRRITPQSEVHAAADQAPEPVAG
jgi:nucleotide-binding universal stress UspA family protein